MPVQRIEIDGVIHEFPDDFTDADIATALGSVAPAAKEPDTYLGGALKGFKEGAIGGAKGFVKGVAKSPVNMVEGMANMLTTDPRTTIKNAVEGIKRIPGVVAGAGSDPEGFGESVGDLTGQTIIGAALPGIVKPAASVTGKAMTIASKHPLPFQLAATHKIMTGQIPSGVAMAMAPEGLRRVGGVLERFGQATPKVPAIEGAATPVATDPILAELAQRYPNVDLTKVKVSPQAGGGWPSSAPAPSTPTPKPPQMTSSAKAGLVNDIPDPQFEAMMDRAAGAEGGVPRLNPSGYGKLQEAAFPKMHFSAAETAEGIKMLQTGVPEANVIKRLLMLQQLRGSDSFTGLK